MSLLSKKLVYSIVDHATFLVIIFLNSRKDLHFDHLNWVDFLTTSVTYVWTIEVAMAQNTAVYSRSDFELFQKVNFPNLEK